DVGVQALLPQQGGGATGAALAVEAAVGDAAGDREAVGQRLQGQLRGGEHVPHHVGPAQVGVQAVAAVVRQGQPRAGEVAGLLGQRQAALERGVGGGVGEQRVHRLARGEQVELAAAELGVVVEAGATAQ